MFSVGLWSLPLAVGWWCQWSQWPLMVIRSWGWIGSVNGVGMASKWRDHEFIGHVRVAYLYDRLILYVCIILWAYDTLCSHTGTLQAWVNIPCTTHIHPHSLILLLSVFFNWLIFIGTPSTGLASAISVGSHSAAGREINQVRNIRMFCMYYSNQILPII